MTTPADAELERLADVLAGADHSRAADIEELTDLDPDQLEYLAHVDELPDPVSDGLEMDRCP